MHALRIAAGVEAASLVILLLNLVTAHLEVITSLGGPVHGTAYLVVIAMTLTSQAATASSARWFAFVPGFGGLLVLRRMHSRTRVSKDQAR
jgi:uncharacterized membrane protein YdcZ (DUF606 family)